MSSSRLLWRDGSRSAGRALLQSFHLWRCFSRQLHGAQLSSTLLLISREPLRRPPLHQCKPTDGTPWLWARVYFERFPGSSGCQPQDLANCGTCHPLPYGDQGTTHKQDTNPKTITEVFPVGPALRSCLLKIQSIIFSTFHHHAQDTKLMRHSLSCSNTHLASTEVRSTKTLHVVENMAVHGITTRHVKNCVCDTSRRLQRNRYWL